MNDQIPAHRQLSYRVGEWLVSPTGCRLTCDTTDVRISPRSMEVLVHLMERAGLAVTNKELLEAYWIGGVTSTNAVHKAIGELRQVFGDDRHQARYIETVQKRGYRLVADVVRIEVPAGTPLINGTGERLDSQQESSAEASAVNVNGSAPIAADPSLGANRRSRSRIAAWSVTALVLLAASGTGLYRVWGPFAALVDRATGRCFASCESKVATVAVLPFKDLSGDPADEYLGEGVAIALIDGIARSKQIELTHPGLAFREKTDGRSIADIAKTLGVDNLLQGTVQRSGNRLRVTLELTRAADGVSLYSGTFDDSIDHLFEFQDGVSEVVRKALSVHLDPFQRAQMIAGGTTNVEAYLAIQEAHFHSHRPTHDDAVKTIEASRRAIELDPKYVDAYWCLVVGLSGFAANGLATNQLSTQQYSQIVEEIRSIADRAAKEIPDSGVDYATKVELAEMTGDLVGEEVALRELIKLRKSPVRRHLKPEGFYASLLRGAGLFDDAKAFTWLEIEILDRGMTWAWEDPQITLHREGMVPVIARYKLAVNENPRDVSTLNGLIALLARRRQFAEAEHYLELLSAADPGGLWVKDARAVVDVYRGQLRANTSELEAFLADPGTSAISAGKILFMLGEIDYGIERWEGLSAPERRFLYDVRRYIEYHMPPNVLGDARYQALLDRLGMGEQWRHYLEDRIRELQPYTGISLASDHPGRAPPGEWRWKT